MKKTKRQSVFQSERISFLKYKQEFDQYGKAAQNFDSVETLWCCVMPLKAQEGMYYVFFQGKTLNWLEGVDVIEWNQKKFDIQSSKQWNARNGLWIDAIVKEQQRC